MLDRILVPLDGSEMFSETLGYIKQLGDASDTEVRLLHVLEPGSEQTPGDDNAANHPLLKGYYDDLSQAGWQVKAELRNGDPVDEITRVAGSIEAGLMLDDRNLKRRFRQVHGDLLTLEYWQGVQDQLLAGRVPRAQFYPEECRLDTAGE